MGIPRPFCLLGSVNEPVVRTEPCEASASRASVNAEQREGGKSYPRNQRYLRPHPDRRGLFVCKGQDSGKGARQLDLELAMGRHHALTPPGNAPRGTEKPHVGNRGNVGGSDAASLKEALPVRRRVLAQKRALTGGCYTSASCQKRTLG